MVRTRDLVLVLVAGVFLVMVIGVTMSRSTWSKHVVGPRVAFDEGSPTETGAMIVSKVNNRTERLEKWREFFKDFVPPEETVEVVGNPVDEISLEGSDTDVVSHVVKCVNYQVNTDVWPRLFLHEQEGARAVADAAVVGTTTHVFAVLPIRTATPIGMSTCLSSDIVGIATNGLPIRVGDSSLYGVFGSDTVVGYALDGYPIHGSHDENQVDKCGGVTTASGYHYVIVPERNSVLQCFSAIPAQLHL